jgi:large subunit ribosomal protein L7Ae
MPKQVKNRKVVSSGAKSTGGSLFTKSPRNFRIGGDIQPIKDMTRFVRWPKYVRIQRQKRIMFLRLKTPPALSQFQSALDRNLNSRLMRLLTKYSPEDRKTKKDRLQKEAEARKGGATGNIGPKPVHLKYGLNHVTNLVEEGKAKLVIIAGDVNPLEIMVHLPALCRAKNVPFAFVRSIARLGRLVNTKTATCVALTDVRKEDLTDFNELQNIFTEQYNNNDSHRKHWAGGVMGIKNQHMMAKREKLREIELAKKANM